MKLTHNSYAAFFYIYIYNDGHAGWRDPLYSPMNCMSYNEKKNNQITVCVEFNTKKNELISRFLSFTCQQTKI